MFPDHKPLVIFGAGAFASLTAHCVTHDSPRTVAAFTVDAPYAGPGTHEGLPLVAFEVVRDYFPPETHDMLLSLGYIKMNQLRQARSEEAKAMGFGLVSYVSSRASVWPDLEIGENALIFEHAILQSFVRLGDNVIVRPGAIIGHHTQVRSHTFIASGVLTGGRVTVGEHCFLGLGAILRDGISIAEGCFVGAGAVVLADTEPDGIYVGNPARRVQNKTPLELT